MERDDVARRRKVYPPWAGLRALGGFIRLRRAKIPIPAAKLQGISKKKLDELKHMF
jgi:hypothetical protein